MAKEQKKYRVLLEVTESWIRGRGTEYHLRKWWQLYSFVLLLFLASAFVSEVVENNLSSYIVLGVLVVVYVVAMVGMNRAGKKFLAETKDKEEPIELPPLPKWLGKSRE